MVKVAASEADPATAWFRTDRPSRAVNIAAPPRDVDAMCTKKSVPISSIEHLADGGTRVVLVTLDAADTIRHAFKDKLLPKDAPRVPLRGHPRYG